MLTDQKIAFIGSGVMAEAMITGLLRQGITTPDLIMASGPRPERGEQLTQKYAIRCTAENAEAAVGAGVVVLSVKPQILPLVLPELQGKIAAEALVLSIVAGQRIKKIADGLGHRAVVRSMPNTPAQIGEGITVWTASQDVCAWAAGPGADPAAGPRPGSVCRR